MSKQRNPRNRRDSRGQRPARGPRPEGAPNRGDGGVWIWGVHAVSAALSNPERRLRRLLVTAQGRDSLGALPDSVPCQVVERRDLDEVLPGGSVHQGVALQTAPLAEKVPEDLDLGAEDALVVILDQATDPHNLGAVLRSAAAFGAVGVIVQDRHAPDATGVVAKAASGALETLPLARATNLARCIEDLKKRGFWCIGLDGRAETSIAATGLSGKLALVLGSEGAGLRRLVRESCDVLAKIPMTGRVESLNLSNAAAVSLYELRRNALAGD